MPALSPVYQPREPTDSPLWKVLHQHYAAFKSGYDEYCEKQYGFFRPVVDEVGEEYLRCGDLHEGFARVRCTNPDCRHEFLVAFSCKGRRLKEAVGNIRIGMGRCLSTMAIPMSWLSDTAQPGGLPLIHQRAPVSERGQRRQ